MRKIIPIVLTVLICFNLVNMVSAVTIEEIADGTYDVVFQCDNENYTVASPSMEFSEIVSGSSWIKFNNTDFNITSTNNINITLSYLNSNFSAAQSGDSVLSFSADTSGGIVWFNLSGFKASTDYTLYRDSVEVATYVSNGDGNLSFSNSVWSVHSFVLKELGSANRLEVSYAYAQLQSRSDTTGIIIVALIIMILFVALLFVMQIKNGEFSIMLTGVMLAMAVSVIIVFAMLSIGTFINDEISGSFIETEEFPIVPDGNDQTVNLRFIPDTIITVKVYKSGVWSAVGSSDFWLDSDKNLVVRASVF